MCGACQQPGLVGTSYAPVGVGGERRHPEDSELARTCSQDHDAVAISAEGIAREEGGCAQRRALRRLANGYVVEVFGSSGGLARLG